MADIPWYKQEAELSLKRKAENARRDRGVEMGDSFLIVTEGTVTEPIYFQLLRDRLKLSTMDICIQPGDGSDPLRVIATAADLAGERITQMNKNREEQSFSKASGFDHVWAVIDTDVADRNDIWEVIQREAAARNVRLAASTPCFEYWLQLHLKETTAGIADGAAAKALLKAAGCDCSSEKAAKVAVPKLLPFLVDAVARAERTRKHHASAGTQEPANPSTDVDLLIRAIDDSLPAHRRKF